MLTAHHLSQEGVKQHEKDIQRYRVSQMESMKHLKQLHEQFKKVVLHHCPYPSRCVG